MLARKQIDRSCMTLHRTATLVRPWATRATARHRLQASFRSIWPSAIAASTQHQP